MNRLPSVTASPTPRPGPLFSETRMPPIAQLLRRRFRSIVLFGMLGLAGALGYLYVTPPRYTAQAILAFGGADARLTATGAAGVSPPVDFATMRTQVQILESWSMSAHAVEQLHLVGAQRDERTTVLTDGVRWLVELEERFLWLLDIHQTTAKAAIYYQLLAAVEDFKRGLSVVTDGRSFIIQVRYKSGDPKRAAESANALAESIWATSWITNRRPPGESAAGCRGAPRKPASSFTTRSGRSGYSGSRTISRTRRASRSTSSNSPS